MNFDEVFKYLRMLHRRRYLFLLVALVVMTGITVGSYFLPKKYKADSTVFIETNVINELVKGIAITPDMEDRIRVLKYALLSRDIISKVLSKIDADLEVETKADLQEAISDLQKRTSIHVKGKELFTVSIVDKDPTFAQDFINTLVSTYVEENISGKREETYGANRFLDEQLVHFKKKLDEAENAIIKFRREQGVVLTESEETLLADILAHRREIQNIQLTIETQKARAASLRAQMEQIEPNVAIFSEKQQEGRLVHIERRISELLLNYTDQYPEVVRLRLEAEELRRRAEAPAGTAPEEGAVTSEMTTVNPVYQQVQQQLLEVEAEIGALRGKKTRLEELMAEREIELQDVPENKKAISMLVQERDSLRKIYQDLLMRMGQSEVSKQMEIGDKTTTFRIVDPAVFPRTPVSPDMVKMILLAIAAGLGAGAGLVVLLENLRSSVKTSAQIQALGIEVLASIPRMKDEVQAARTRRRDLLVYACSGVYFCGIVGLLAWEFVNRMA